MCQFIIWSIKNQPSLHTTYKSVKILRSRILVNKFIGHWVYILLRACSLRNEWIFYQSFYIKCWRDSMLLFIWFKININGVTWISYKNVLRMCQIFEKIDYGKYSFVCNSKSKYSRSIDVHDMPSLAKYQMIQLNVFKYIWINSRFICYLYSF